MEGTRVHIVDREAMEVLGFRWIQRSRFPRVLAYHSAATESEGNIYLGEVDTGRRAYRWNCKGTGSR